MKDLPKFETFEDFINWINEDEDRPKLIYTKRRGIYCFHFNFYDGKVNYLIGDGVSVGRCKLENLYKHLKYN
jgi:hypothetical protein